MAKSKKLSYNEIPNLDEDWSLDPRNGFKYSGDSVQKFIKGEIVKANSIANEKIKAFHWNVSTLTMYGFTSDERKEAYLDTNDSSYIDMSMPMEFTGTIRSLKVLDNMGNKNLFFTTAQEAANISVRFISQQKGITDVSWEEVYEDFLVTVSVDKGSKGSWETIASNILVLNGNDFSIDVIKYLAIGANRVKFTVKGTETNEVGTSTYIVNLTSMFISPANFAWNVPFIENEPYNLGGLNIGGDLNKTLHIKVSNGFDYTKTYDVNIGLEQYINTSYFYSKLEFPTSGTGVYHVEIWVSANGVESQHLEYNIICVSAADKLTASLVAFSNVPDTVYNYSENKLFEYVVYDKGFTTSTLTVDVSSHIKDVITPVITEELKNISTSTINSYTLGIELDSQESEIKLNVNVSLGEATKEFVYSVDNSLSYPAVVGYSFYLNPSLRNNTQDNREKIINVATNEEVDAEWTRMSWVDKIDGWTVDEFGRKCLFIPAKSKCITNVKPLTNIGYGKTIEFTFRAKTVSDYSEPIITICDDPTIKRFKGIKITPGNVLVHSNDLTISDLTQGIDIQDEVVKHVIITIIRNYKVTYGNLCQIYIDGIKAKSFEFNSSDSWNVNANLIFGSNTTDTYIYNFKIYDKGFEKQDSEKNYVSSLSSLVEKKYMNDFINSVRDDIGNIDYDAVYGRYNTMEVEMLNDSELPHKGLSKEYSAWCNVEFNFIQLPDYYKTKVWNFILQKCKIEGQGTTSMNYWLWNLRFRIDKSDNIVVIYPDGQEQILE